MYTGPEAASDRLSVPERFAAAHRAWLRARRSEDSDAEFLAEVRHHLVQRLRMVQQIHS